MKRHGYEYYKEPVTISLTTHCPSKWLIVDLENGQVYKHTGKALARVMGPRAERLYAEDIK